MRVIGSKKRKRHAATCEHIDYQRGIGSEGMHPRRDRVIHLRTVNIAKRHYHLGSVERPRGVREHGKAADLVNAVDYPLRVVLTGDIRFSLHKERKNMINAYFGCVSAYVIFCARDYGHTLKISVFAKRPVVSNSNSVVALRPIGTGGLLGAKLAVRDRRVHVKPDLLSLVSFDIDIHIQPSSK